MENNPFFTSWFLCDLCFEDCFEQISISKLTSCGHILCPKCSSLINDYCPICKTKCTSINFGSNIENLPKSTLDFFQDSTKLIEKFLTIQKFQNSHKQRVFIGTKNKMEKLEEKEKEIQEYKKKKLILKNQINRLIEENENLKNQNLEMKKKIENYQNPKIKKLEQKNIFQTPKSISKTIRSKNNLNLNLNLNLKEKENEKEKEKENYNKIKKRIYQSDQWVGKREGNIVRSPHPKTPSLSRKMIKKKNLKQNSLKSPKFFDENLSFLLSPVPSFKKRNIKKKK